MTLPSWQDKKLGSMARAALWLVQVVGEGNVFTKAQLRAAFPDVAQIDRRIRDLRDHDWRIDTSRDDVSLQQQEQRFVARGADVWIPGKSKAPKHKSSLTTAQRMKIFQADNHLCRSCGIAGGEAYEDGVTLAVLNVARRKMLLPSGEIEHQPVTECKRCGAGGGDHEVDLAAILDLTEALSSMERRIFLTWIAADQRPLSPMEKMWGIFRTLPEESRKAVTDALNDMDDQDD
ncbi:hypothetical protein AQI95_31295 [Streptomyces yokosukanensis]|uniref:HNH endonuclease n=1 Tax=Streptomyces yokosukanensis TaxID=67386 RepID=A0A101NY92_9ACTN|nr:hypothetical protein [Streptomyces yokosukanensis]KUN01413.1 hypothetical protein AQI95_31295 [Streptomyces yokosukanensis]